MLCWWRSFQGCLCVRSSVWPTYGQAPSSPLQVCVLWLLCILPIRNKQTGKNTAHSLKVKAGCANACCAMSCAMRRVSIAGSALLQRLAPSPPLWARTPYGLAEQYEARLQIRKNVDALVGCCPLAAYVTTGSLCHVAHAPSLLRPSEPRCHCGAK